MATDIVDLTPGRPGLHNKTSVPEIQKIAEKSLEKLSLSLEGKKY